MDALDVVKVCLRRWYVALPVVMLAVVAGLGIAHQQKPNYTAFGSYALVYEHADAIKINQPDPRNANPLSADNAQLLGEALVADLMSGTQQLALGGQGNSGVAPNEAPNGTSYSVSLPQGSLSFLVQSWGEDPQELTKVVDGVLTAAQQRATVIQENAGAPEISQYSTFVTGPTQIIELAPTSTLKLVIAIGGIGVLAGAALSLVADRLLTNRSRRIAARRAADEEDDSPADAGLAPPEETLDDEARPPESEPERPSRREGAHVRLDAPLEEWPDQGGDEEANPDREPVLVPDARTADAEVSAEERNRNAPVGPSSYSSRPLRMPRAGESPWTVKARRPRQRAKPKKPVR